MKVTAQTEYGLRCLLQLARHGDRSQPLTVAEIARREALSRAYVEKLLRLLSRAGLTASIRGVHGGYRIARPADTVTVGEVVRALGGFMTQEELCARFTGQEDRCVHLDDCGLRPVWRTVHRHVRSFLDQLPVTFLLEEERVVTSRLGGGRDRISILPLSPGDS